ncbi:MAG: DUF4886 domain-containing protein [Planctomycetota bacterium]
MLYSLVRLRYLAATIFLCAATFLLAADGEKSAKTVRLLTVGNSFSQNATRHLAELAKAGGHQLIHAPAVIGGAAFTTHLERYALHEEDATKGTYGNQGGLKEILKSEPWDCITIQQASIRSHNVETYRPSARELYDIIKAGAPNSEVLMHQTWAYRVDDPRFKITQPKPGEPATREQMYEGLTSAYHTIAHELGLRVIPTGDAFYLADSDSNWGYKPDTAFDFKAAKKPALPDQLHSLHIGFRWQNESISLDGHHANQAGEYLGGCVWYEVLFGESVVGNKFVPAGMDPAYAQFLQETAHKAVAAAPDFRKPAE